MKSVNAYVKQLFNVKALATAGLTIENIPDNTFGIVDTTTGLTVTSLPNNYLMVVKSNGKTIYSVNHIEKSKTFNLKAKDYVAPVAEVWKGTIECCSCIDQMILNLNLDEASLQMMSGLSWTHKDTAVVIAPEELKCLCKCGGDVDYKVYNNNVMTKVLVEKVNNMKSPYYTAGASIDITGITTGGTLPASPAEFDMYIKTGATPGLHIYNGTAWVLVGTETGVLTDIDAFIEIFEVVNTDTDETNDGPLMTLEIYGTNVTMPIYHDIERNYISPRGVRIQPSLQSAKGDCTTVFEKTTSLVFEIGAGYDLRAEEFQNMNFYTDLNYQMTLEDGFQNPNMFYQFENLKKYNTVSFEYFKDKVNKNDGDKAMFGVTLGIENSGVYATIKTLFGV